MTTAPAAGDEWLDLLSSAAVVGGYCAIEQRFHRRLGVIALTVETPALRCYLAAASMSHGWRAGLWERLLPVSVGLPGPDELARLSGVGTRLVEEVEETASVSEGLLDVLLSSVYPEMLAGYRARAEGTELVSDGPLALAATRAGSDLERVIEDGELVRIALGAAARPARPAG